MRFVRPTAATRSTNLLPIVNYKISKCSNCSIDKHEDNSVNGTSLWYTTERPVLTRGNFTDSKTTAWHAEVRFSAPTCAFHSKNASEHRAIHTPNISEAQEKRASRAKVILILRCKFFVSTHGSHYGPASSKITRILIIIYKILTNHCLKPAMYQNSFKVAKHAKKW